MLPRPEHPVPQDKRGAEVGVGQAPLHRMMDPVIARGVEDAIDPAQLADGFRVAPERRHFVQENQEEKLYRVKSQDGKRQEEEVVDEALEPTEPNRSQEVHVLAGMMNRVDRPAEPSAVQHAMFPVVDEIDQQVAQDRDRDRCRKVPRDLGVDPGERSQADPERQRAERQLPQPHRRVCNDETRRIDSSKSHGPPNHLAGHERKIPCEPVEARFPKELWELVHRLEQTARMKMKTRARSTSAPTRDQSAPLAQPDASLGACGRRRGPAGRWGPGSGVSGTAILVLS